MTKLLIKQLNSTDLITCDEQQQVNIIGGSDVILFGLSGHQRMSPERREKKLWGGYAEGDYDIEVQDNGDIWFYDRLDNEVGLIDP
ncbi:MAG: hypothetical protein QNJ53_20195 [Pleurocapsa sp. MO_192.B19]|nr:hypothetical protein [Pleurocapsa sp. MO_192.B19]